MTYWTDTVQMHRACCKECGAVHLDYDVDAAHEWMQQHTNTHGVVS